jgi:Integrase zinc binding domain
MLIQASRHDPVAKLLTVIIQQGWPDEPSALPDEIRAFYTFRDELIVEDGLVFKGERLYVPLEARTEVCDRIHASHIGMNGCMRRAREAVFWPNMTVDISKIVTSCAVCAKVQSEQSKEPLQSHEIPDRPWQIIACDLFEYNHIQFLITVDYYSNLFDLD